MSNIKKTFDAVEMMRAIRDEISSKIQDMSLEEELEWLAKQEIEDPFLRRLREKAARSAEATGVAMRHRSVTFRQKG